MMSRPIVVVEDDPFPRLIQVILDPATPPARVAAFSHFFAHELPDLEGWCGRQRARLARIHPAEVRLVTNQDALLAAMPGATVVVTESLAVGQREIAAGGGALRIVQKYGTVLSNIDTAACTRANVRVLTLRRRANISCAEHALGLMLSLARKIHETAGLVSVEQLRAAGYVPTQYDRAHTANANWARITGTRNLYGRQLGIVGMGEIGRELATQARRRSVCASPMPSVIRLPEEETLRANYALLDLLLAASDFVSLTHVQRRHRGIIGDASSTRSNVGQYQHLAPSAGGARSAARSAAQRAAWRVRPRSALRCAGARRRPPARLPQRHRDSPPRGRAPLQFT
jgi:phosphoglycerate dehydrogenase-like enzyme